MESQRGVIPLIVVLVVGATLAGGAATVVAADQAKPGDLLYPVDTAVENVRLALARTEEQITLRQQFAEERLKEVKALVEEKGVDAPGLDVALANVALHRKKLAQILAEHQSLKAREEEIDQFFDTEEKALERLLETKRETLEDRKEQLKKQLESALETANATQAAQIRQQLDKLEKSIDLIKQRKEKAKEMLEKKKEAAEERLEKAKEQLEEQKENIKEQLQERLHNIKEESKLRKDKEPEENKETELEETHSEERRQEVNTETNTNTSVGTRGEDNEEHEDR